MQKFYWNQQAAYSERYKTYQDQGAREEWCEDFSRLTLPVNCNPTQGSCGVTDTDLGRIEHACRVHVVDSEVGERQPIVSTNRVVVRLGPDREREYNRTWNERTKSQYSRARRSVEKSYIFNHHDYENVYDDGEFPVKEKCVSASARNTPRSRKKKRPEGRVYRSKSCERVTGMLDRLSEKLSLHSESGSPPPPATPTPSLLQSVAARAIPCVDMKPPSEGCSVYESVAGSTLDGCKDIFRPAANLADRMRGRMEYVNKKIKIIRSRSAERLRGYIRPEVLQAGEEKRSQTGGQSYSRYQAEPLSLPVLGQARAIVSFTPSPYDKDILRYEAGDIIDIIQMNPNGLWRGRCGNQTGQFKFINVELVPESRRRRQRNRGRSLSKVSGPEHCKVSSIAEVLRVLDMSDYLPVFVLNGYEDLTLLKDLDDAELDYLGITDSRHREKLINIASVIFPGESECLECI